MLVYPRNKAKSMTEKVLKPHNLLLFGLVSVLTIVYLYHHRQTTATHKRSYSRHMQVAYSGTPEEYLSAKIASIYENRYTEFLGDRHWPGLDFGQLKNCPYLRSDTIDKEANKKRMSSVYLEGNGIELGFNSPRVFISSKVNSTKLVLSHQQHSTQQNETKQITNDASDNTLQTPDIVDSLHLLTTFERQSQDFIISNNVLQHTEHVILALHNYLRITKVNGLIYLILPNRCYSSSRHRVVTSFKHMLQEYNYPEYIEKNRKEHFREWALNQFKGEATHHCA